MASCWGSMFPKAGVTVLKIRKAYVWLLSILLLPVAAVYIVLRCMSRGLALLTAFVFERLGPKPRQGEKLANPIVKFLEDVYENEPCQ